MFHFVERHLDGRDHARFRASDLGRAIHEDEPVLQDMPMQQNGSNMKMRKDCMQMGKGMQMGKDMPCAGQTAEATGVIEAIDATKGTVTIKHHARACLKRFARVPS